jgi:hypothetical protein
MPSITEVVGASCLLLLAAGVLFDVEECFRVFLRAKSVLIMRFQQREHPRHLPLSD